MLFLVIKVNSGRGDLTDVSAETTSLVSPHVFYSLLNVILTVTTFFTGYFDPKNVTWYNKDK